MVTTPLRERMRELLRIRNYSPHTVRAYIRCVARFAAHFRRSPDKLGAREIRAYQLFLRDDLHVCSSTFNQASAALRFFYTHVVDQPELERVLLFARTDHKLPTVLSPEELVRLLEAFDDPDERVLFTTVYSAGLRISEALALRVEDIDSQRMLIHIRRGKGRKDRYVPLSPILLEMLRVYWRRRRPREILFPSRNDRSRPRAQRTICRHIALAASRAGLTKRVTPHTLRHSYATHLLEHGTNIRVIQVLLGHGSLRSTMTYMHVAPAALERAASPLDSLPGSLTDANANQQ